MCNKINKKLLGSETENGLACPFAKADPDRYVDQASCRPDRGWPNVKDIAEHIWRFHSPLYRCEYCGYRWTGVKSRADVRRHRDAHIPGCRKQYGGTLRLCEPTDLEILSQAQQSEFEKVVKIRNIEKKFAALYRACGKPEPETYHVKALAGPSQIPTNSSSFLDGFSRPDADTDSTTQQSQTALSQTQLEHNYRQSQTADGADPTLSCADNLQVDQDSAYHSRDHDEPDFEQLMSPYQGFGSSYRGDGSAPLNWFEAHLAGFEHQDGLGEEIEELDLNPCGIVLK